jgi:RNA polymerase sigma-70 factor (ECF subfamily)
MPDADATALERELVAKIMAGDEAAFQQFYDSHKKRLERTAIHFLGGGNPSIPDVIQETFAACLPKLKDFRFESSLYTWLNRFTVNFCFQALNKGKKTLLSETEELEAWSRPKPDLPEEIKLILRDAVQELDEGHRVVIEMKDFEGQSYLEIAAALKIAPGTVMSRLSRARKELRRLLEGKKAVLESLWGRA